LLDSLLQEIPLKLNWIFNEQILILAIFVLD